MSVLLSAFDIRSETTFCDVSFLVQGHLYRAHRIIVRYIECDCLFSYFSSHHIYLTLHLFDFDENGFANTVHGVGGCEHC